MNAVAFQSTVFQRDGMTPFKAAGAGERVFPTHRTIVQCDRLPWNEALRKRFDHLCKLQPGWDGYRGQPVSFACAHFAAAILERLYTPELPPPSLVPGGDGTLQIEWHRNGYDIELDIIGPYKVVAFRFDRQSEEEMEVDIENDFSGVTAWLKDMSAKRQGKEASE